MISVASTSSSNVSPCVSSIWLVRLPLGGRALVSGHVRNRVHAPDVLNACRDIAPHPPRDRLLVRRLQLVRQAAQHLRSDLEEPEHLAQVHALVEANAALDAHLVEQFAALATHFQTACATVEREQVRHQCALLRSSYRLAGPSPEASAWDNSSRLCRLVCLVLAACALSRTDSRHSVQRGHSQVSGSARE